MSADRALSVVLRVNGVITLLALPAVFMPLNWMARAHRGLGLGELPSQPVFEYLARSTSFLYAIHGGLCLLLARDVRRFGPVVTYVAVSQVCFAGLLLWIDRTAQMPAVWTWVEAPLVLLFGGVILGLRVWGRFCTGVEDVS